MYFNLVMLIALSLSSNLYASEQVRSTDLEMFSISFSYKPAFAVAGFKEDFSAASVNGGEVRIETINGQNLEFGLSFSWNGFLRGESQSSEYIANKQVSGLSVSYTLVQQALFYGRYYINILDDKDLRLFFGLGLGFANVDYKLQYNGFDLKDASVYMASAEEIGFRWLGAFTGSSIDLALDFNQSYNYNNQLAQVLYVAIKLGIGLRF